MNFKELDEMLYLPESETLEYRTGVSTVEQLAYLIASFANSQGGTIVLGVQETRSRPEVTGCNKSWFERQYSEAIERLSPPPQLSRDDCEERGVFVPIIKVEKSSEPVFVDGTVWRRDQSSTRPMTVQELGKNLPASNDFQERLMTAVVHNTEQIASLQAELQQANSWNRRLSDQAIGSLFGAVFGLIVGAMTITMSAGDW